MHEQYLPSSDKECNTVRWQKPCLQGGGRKVSVSPSYTGGVCGIIAVGLVCMVFSFFFLLSYSIFILAFKKNQISPGVYCPYIRFHSYSLHYNFLFRIIYESKFFFSISSPINFFHLSDLILILFIAIYFILDGF